LEDDVTLTGISCTLNRQTLARRNSTSAAVLGFQESGRSVAHSSIRSESAAVKPCCCGRWSNIADHWFEGAGPDLKLPAGGTGKTTVLLPASLVQPVRRAHSKQWVSKGADLILFGSRVRSQHLIDASLRLPHSFHFWRMSDQALRSMAGIRVRISRSKPT
jgi:hypothetical protein